MELEPWWLAGFLSCRGKVDWVLRQRELEIRCKLLIHTLFSSWWGKQLPGLRFSGVYVAGLQPHLRACCFKGMQWVMSSCLGSEGKCRCPLPPPSQLKSLSRSPQCCSLQYFANFLLFIFPLSILFPPHPFPSPSPIFFCNRVFPVAWSALGATL